MILYFMIVLVKQLVKNILIDLAFKSVYRGQLDIVVLEEGYGKERRNNI